MSTMGEVIVSSQCHKLLNMRDFTGARSLVKMNKQLHKEWQILDQVEAICDVIIAAENRLPNGFMDYYGMIRVARLGPVVLDDFRRLIKLLDWRCNGLPCSQEAAQYAYQAWSLLSKPAMKAEYDLDISFPVARGNSSRVGMVQQGFPEGSSFVPKEQIPDLNVGYVSDDNEVVVISDDDDEGDENDQDVITMARTSKLCMVNGRRVKLIPKKKKTKESSTSNVKKT